MTVPDNNEEPDATQEENELENPGSFAFNLLAVLAEDKEKVLYRPKLARALGGVIPACVLNQMIYWWDKRDEGRTEFYKFAQPNKHNLYKKGHSWCEELAVTKHELESALHKIGTKITADSGKNKQDVLRDTVPLWNPETGTLRNASSLVVYWTDGSRVTWYRVNEALLSAVLYDIYLFPKTGIASSTYFRKPEYQKKQKNGTPGNPKSGNTSTETTTETTRDSSSSRADGAPPGEGSDVQVPADVPVEDEKAQEAIGYRLLNQFLNAWKSRHGRYPSWQTQKGAPGRFGKAFRELVTVSGFAESEVAAIITYFVCSKDTFLEQRAHDINLLFQQWDSFVNQYRSQGKGNRNNHGNRNQRRPASGMGQGSPIPNPGGNGAGNPATGRDGASDPEGRPVSRAAAFAAKQAADRRLRAETASGGSGGPQTADAALSQV